MSLTSRPDPALESTALLRPRAIAADPPHDASTELTEPSLATILAEFTARWDEGRRPRAEHFAGLLAPGRGDAMVELIYHEYCLAETAGHNPDPDEYLRRFPAVREPLERLLHLHETIGASQLLGWSEPVDLPEVGDEIGPYRLVRELGRGGFARVFLAEQADLDDRPVVVKVSRQVTTEPRLLARARHPHIVEVLWHGLAEGGSLQLICMPFLGGATLSSLLAVRPRRGVRPKTGRDLLAALDRVGAPEYPRSGRDRPARAILARLDYPRAMAWVVARLAEALDHAAARGVAHGDVKPSNVLVTADGVPMLLDFNLAVGWQYPAAAVASSDPGGTLVYMAPERLRCVADPSRAERLRPDDRHRADLYSLGMVLLETLAGRPPDLLPKGPGRAQAELAAAYARSRERGAGAMIRDARAPIPPALRSILSRCLAPDPADRYKRGAELAEDLDRWRTDRALAFAKEPAWRPGPIRWARRHRRPLAAVALAAVVAASAALAVVQSFRGSLRDQSLAKLALAWDRPEAGTGRSLWIGDWQPAETVDPAAVALRRLELYDVTGPGDWRNRDDVRSLPRADREELEAWLLEQVLRYTRALGERPDSPSDWRRGLALLERTLAIAPLAPLRAQAHLLAGRLGLPDPRPLPGGGDGAAPPARWVEDYLLGVEAEPTRARDALTHYRNALLARPRSFWAHYATAAASCRLRDFATAAEHYRSCLALRPDSAPLHNLLAGCLVQMGRYDAALAECDRSLVIDPDQADAYRTRTYIRNHLGQKESGDRAADVNRYEVLTRYQGPAPAQKLRLEEASSSSLDGPAGRLEMARRILDITPGDRDLRADRALDLWKAGRYEEALSEIDDVLGRDPEHLQARHVRATMRRGLGRAGADDDFAVLLRHPRREEYLRSFERLEDVTSIHCFVNLSRAALRLGMSREEAIGLAKRGLALAIRIKSDVGASHYNLAHIYAEASKSDPGLVRLAEDHLRKALETCEHARGWAERDKAFEHIRPRVQTILAARR
jgi:eukaryotic-like serine/threonine-protein kinase